MFFAGNNMTIVYQDMLLIGFFLLQQLCTAMLPDSLYVVRNLVFICDKV